MDTEFSFVDIHCHLHAGLDDGPATIEEAVELCRTAYKEGVRRVVAIAHQSSTYPNNTPQTIIQSASQLMKRLAEEQISLDVVPAGEWLVDADWIERFDQIWPNLLTYNNDNAYGLVEFPYHCPHHTVLIVDRLERKGVKPILAHIDRYRELMGDPRRVRRLIDEGFYVQLNADAIDGRSGAELARESRRLIQQGMVHLVASDGHDLKRRPPHLKGAYDRVVDWAGKDTAKLLFFQNPWAVLVGEQMSASLAASWVRKFWPVRQVVAANGKHSEGSKANRTRTSEPTVREWSTGPAMASPDVPSRGLKIADSASSAETLIASSSKSTPTTERAKVDTTPLSLSATQPIANVVDAAKPALVADARTNEPSVNALPATPRASSEGPVVEITVARVGETLGLDIGGASLKASQSNGKSASLRFPLWREPDRLAQKLTELVAPFEIRRLAITMTAELCDCFATKEQGVTQILQSVGQAFPKIPEIWVWRSTGRFARLQDAVRDPWKTAAANWLALATLCSHWSDGKNSLLIDIGSTTTDIIPIRGGRPAPVGRTDPDRLTSGELVYQGVERTPICALLSSAQLGGRRRRLMTEWFANTLDAYLILGQLSEEEAHPHTCDGRPATRENARDRLARMVGADRTQFDESQCRELAEAASAAQLTQLVDAVDQVAETTLAGAVHRVFLSGQGEFLGRLLTSASPRLREAETVSLTEKIGADASRAACAHAVAALLDASIE